MDEIKQLLRRALVEINNREHDEAISVIEDVLSKLPTHLVDYTHRHGHDTFLVRYLVEGCDPSEADIVAVMDLNFEPDREEFIEISCVPDVTLIEPGNESEAAK